MLRNELVPVDRLSGEREMEAGELKRLGDKPIIIEFASDGAKIQVAARAEHRALLAGPFTTPPTSTRPATDPL